MCGRRAPLAHAVFYAAKRAYAIKGISSFCVLEEKYFFGKSRAPKGVSPWEHSGRFGFCAYFYI